MIRHAKQLYKGGQLSIPATLEGPRINKSSFPAGVNSVYRTHSGDNKQRMW